jgi:2-polyprenyl-6-methoxyphenol hydroxylase-like FAD-dependent oxidoreductase
MERRVQCAIAGGGPAGLMLGVLLARAGVTVAVLEKHADFLRDFRGDTIHPSTMTIMHELGWLEDFLKLPHNPVKELYGQFGDERVRLADFSHLPVPARYIAMMPQWDFLNFLAEKGKQYPGFHLYTRAEAIDLVFDATKVVGVTVRAPEGWRAVSADLVVCADGRGSILRERAGFKPQDFGAPMDVMWFRLPRKETDTAETLGRFDAGRIFIMLNRGNYWQCAFVIPKGAFADVKERGLGAFQASVGALVPFEAERAKEISDWAQVALLTVKVDRLDTWARAGLVCIGDAAHAMSPIGGVGVNLAVQDAVAAANLLARPLREGRLSLDDLNRVQARREFPARVTQGLQLFLQKTVIKRALSAEAPMTPPLPMRALLAVPYLNRIPARLIGLGVRPEHVSAEIRAGRG